MVFKKSVIQFSIFITIYALQAAFCQLHIAALMAEYLKHQGEFPEGCQCFSIISHNIPRDESNLRLDAGMYRHVE